MMGIIQVKHFSSYFITLYFKTAVVQTLSPKEHLPIAVKTQIRSDEESWGDE